LFVLLARRANRGKPEFIGGRRNELGSVEDVIRVIRDLEQGSSPGHL
jgi:hypothetical protein